MSFILPITLFNSVASPSIATSPMYANGAVMAAVDSDMFTIPMAFANASTAFSLSASKLFKPSNTLCSFWIFTIVSSIFLVALSISFQVIGSVNIKASVATTFVINDVIDFNLITSFNELINDNSFL